MVNVGIPSPVVCITRTTILHTNQVCAVNLNNNMIMYIVQYYSTRDILYYTYYCVRVTTENGVITAACYRVANLITYSVCFA